MFATRSASAASADGLPGLTSSTVQIPINQPRTDQSNTNFSPYAYHDFSQGAVWQSFTAALSGSLYSIHVQGYAGNAAMFIYEGEGTSGTLLYSSSYRPLNAVDTEFLTGQVPVTAGSKYTFLLVGSGYVFGTYDDSYAGGRCGGDFEVADLWFYTVLSSYYATSQQFQFAGILTNLTVVGTATFSGNVGIGTDNPQYKLDVVGEAAVHVLTIRGGSDLAEPFDIADADDLRPGMVVSIDSQKPGNLRVSTRAYDQAVAGIISGAGGVRTGLMLKQEASLASGKHPVALSGRVYCYADAAAGGPIQPGDLLTTSDTPGHAMKATDVRRRSGAIIGKAMSRLDRGTGLVLVLVNLQ
jgi:hypothetical protein